MSLDGHIESLKQKHATLESRIEQEAHRPNPDEVTLHDLKRKKLKIKDELETIGRDVRH